MRDKARKKKDFNFNGGGPRSSGKAVEHSPSRDPHKVAFKTIRREMEGRRVIVLSQRDTFLRIKALFMHSLFANQAQPFLCVYIGDEGNYVGLFSVHGNPNNG